MYNVCAGGKGEAEVAAIYSLYHYCYLYVVFRLEGSYSLLLSHFINKCAKVDKRLNWPVKEIKWTGEIKLIYIYRLLLIIILIIIAVLRHHITI